MADAYAKEFEKWLQKTSDSSQEDEETDGDLVDEEEEEEMFVDVDEDEEKLIWERGKKASNLSNAVLQRNDSAPYLLDDDDEEFPCEKIRFEEEPPVLEPVLKMARETFQTDHSDSGPKPHKYNRNYYDYSRKKSSEKPNCLLKQADSVDLTKGICSKQNSQPDAETGQEVYRRYSNPSKDTESDNIFDKFSSMSEVTDDDPPPLIHSQHGVPTVFASPNDQVDKAVDSKLIQNSPDFCAMEADSTSEITGAQMKRVSTSTVGLGDLSLECDSTCMLGASPVVVSPASLFVADGDDGHESGNGGPIRKTSVEDDGKVEILSEETGHRSKFVGCNSVSKEVEDDKTHQRNRDWPAPCLELSRVDGMSVHAGEFMQETQKVEELEEPPVLPVMRLSATGCRRSRLKRHTIDTPETFSHSGKNALSIPSLTVDAKDHSLDNCPPPKLSHISENMTSGTDACFFDDDKSTTSLNHLSRDWSNFSQENKRRHRKKQRRRCNTVPLVETDQISGRISEELHKFVVATSDLSALQSRAHKLLGLLFPQLEVELATMSPESSRFETLLRETIDLMEQQERHKRDEEVCQKLREEEDLKELFTRPMDKLNHSVKVEKNFSSLQYQQEIVSHSILSFSEERGENVKGQDNTPQVACDMMVPELSRLTIDNGNGAGLSLALRVLLPRNPELLLARFSKQLCHAVQLLLPELTVSLISELQSSPSDLLVFLDNVIAANEHSREGSSPSQH